MKGRAESTGSKARRRNDGNGMGRTRTGTERGDGEESAARCEVSEENLVGNRMDVHCVSVPIKSAGG